MLNTRKAMFRVLFSLGLFLFLATPKFLTAATESKQFRDLIKTLNKKQCGQSAIRISRFEKLSDHTKKSFEFFCTYLLKGPKEASLILETMSKPVYLSGSSKENYEVGTSALAGGMYEIAKFHLSKVKDSSKYFKFSRFYLGVSYLGLDKFSLTIRVLESVLTQEKLPKRYRKMGARYLKQARKAIYDKKKLKSVSVFFTAPPILLSSEINSSNNTTEVSSKKVSLSKLSFPGKAYFRAVYREQAQENHNLSNSNLQVTELGLGLNGILRFSSPKENSVSLKAPISFDRSNLGLNNSGQSLFYSEDFDVFLVEDEEQNSAKQRFYFAGAPTIYIPFSKYTRFSLEANTIQTGILNEDSSVYDSVGIKTGVLMVGKHTNLSILGKFSQTYEGEEQYDASGVELALDSTVSKKQFEGSLAFLSRSADASTKSGRPESETSFFVNYLDHVGKFDWKLGFSVLTASDPLSKSRSEVYWKSNYPSYWEAENQADFPAKSNIGFNAQFNYTPIEKIESLVFVRWNQIEKRGLYDFKDTLGSQDYFEEGSADGTEILYRAQINVYPLRFVKLSYQYDQLTGDFVPNDEIYKNAYLNQIYDSITRSSGLFEIFYKF